MADTYALGKALQQYMVNMLENVKTELESNFDEWAAPGRYFDKLADEQAAAAARQVSALKEVEEERRRSFERSMFAISLIAPFALSWMSAHLQYTLGPKLFSKSVNERVTGVADGFMVSFEMNKLLGNQIANKVFGDMGKELATWVGGMGKTIALDAHKEIDGRKVAGSANLHSFKTNLLQEINGQKDQAVRTIMKVKQDVVNDIDYGQGILKRLHKTNPASARLPVKAQEQAGIQMIIVELNNKRRKWADEFSFYGTKPPQPNWQNIGRMIERQMWALWIIQEKLEYSKAGPGVLSYVSFIKGASGPLDNDAFITNLHSLNLPVLDLERRHHSKEQVDRLNTWAATELKKSPIERGIASSVRRTQPSVELIYS